MEPEHLNEWRPLEREIPFPETKSLHLNRNRPSNQTVQNARIPLPSIFHVQNCCYFQGGYRFHVKSDVTSPVQASHHFNRRDHGGGGCNVPQGCNHFSNEGEGIPRFPWLKIYKHMIIRVVWATGWRKWSNLYMSLSLKFVHLENKFNDLMYLVRMMRHQHLENGI